MITIRGDMTTQIISEIDVFGLIMQRHVIKNDFNREYAPLSTVQQGMAIEFLNNGQNNLYLGLNNSRLHEIAKIIKADETNIDADTAGQIKLTLHSMIRRIV